MHSFPRYTMYIPVASGLCSEEPSYTYSINIHTCMPIFNTNTYTPIFIMYVHVHNTRKFVYHNSPPVSTHDQWAWSNLALASHCISLSCHSPQGGWVWTSCALYWICTSSPLYSGHTVASCPPCLLRYAAGTDRDREGNV